MMVLEDILIVKKVIYIIWIELMLLVNKEREKLLEFINRKNLYKIDDNKDVIDNIMSNNR